MKIKCILGIFLFYSLPNSLHAQSNLSAPVDTTSNQCYLLINWNTYIGNENSSSRPDFGNRYFTDIYFIYKRNKFSETSFAYIGVQEAKSAMVELKNYFWYNLNVIGSYKFTAKFSLSGCLEYFDDPNSVRISSVSLVKGFPLQVLLCM